MDLEKVYGINQTNFEIVQQACLECFYGEKSKKDTIQILQAKGLSKYQAKRLSKEIERVIQWKQRVL